MPKVELMLACLNDITFQQKKTIEIDTDEWMDMTPKEREERITEEGEAFLRASVEWDYRVL